MDLGNLRVATVMTGHAVLGHRVPRRQKLTRIGPVMFPHEPSWGSGTGATLRKGLKPKTPRCPPERKL